CGIAITEGQDLEEEGTSPLRRWLLSSLLSTFYLADTFVKLGGTISLGKYSVLHYYIARLTFERCGFWPAK
ncbi:hypothetical protein GOP47_0013791, partial [Adiantum capillus-veneris]